MVIYRDLSAFLFISNNKRNLESLRKDINKKFLVNIYKITYGKENIGCYGKHVYKYWYNNTNLSKFLYDIGTPKGSKVLTIFDIPTWIKENKEFAREYLRIAFLCEGTKFKVSKNSERIQFNINKAEKLLDNGLNFINSLKILLLKFNIYSSKIRITNSNNKEGWHPNQAT